MTQEKNCDEDLWTAYEPVWSDVLMYAGTSSPEQHLPTWFWCHRSYKTIILYLAKKRVFQKLWLNVSSLLDVLCQLSLVFMGCSSQCRRDGLIAVLRTYKQNFMISRVSTFTDEKNSLRLTNIHEAQWNVLSKNGRLKITSKKPNPFLTHYSSTSCVYLHVLHESVLSRASSMPITGSS